MTTAKLALYSVAIACFIAAGVLELSQRQWKLGIVAVTFGFVNAVIFFWR